MIGRNTDGSCGHYGGVDNDDNGGRGSSNDDDNDDENIDDDNDKEEYYNNSDDNGDGAMIMTVVCVFMVSVSASVTSSGGREFQPAGAADDGRQAAGFLCIVTG